MQKLLMAVSICTCGIAFAQAPSGKSATPPPGKPTAPPSGAAAAPMEMPKPGPDQEALKPFIHNGSYTGTHMMEGKEMPEKGRQTCKWLPGGMWASCDIEMTSGSGKTAMKWNGHLVMGYDNMAKGYRAVMTDSMGTMSRMKGTLDGKKMVWESMDEMKGGPPGMPTKERVTDDATDPKSEKMTFEGEVNGKWMPMGSGAFKTSGK
jgi:hypothetical protein